MGLRDTMTRGLHALSATTQRLTLDTACYVVQHGLPYYIGLSDVASHPFLQNVWQIFKQDVVPIVVADAMNQGTQSALREYHHPLAESIKWGVWGASSVVVLGRVLEGTARAVVLTVEAGSMLSTSKNDNISRYKQLCEEAHCTQLRFIQGGVRDFIAYEATGWLISTIQYLPFVGSSLSTVGSLWNSGGYVCSSIMPICNRHLVENKQHHPAFVVAIGLHHALMTALVSSLIHVLARLPSDLYRDYWDENSQWSMDISENYQHDFALVGQLCLVLEMMLVANMTWPDPVIKADRYFYNPLMAFQRLVGFIFDTLAKGSKKTFPPLLKAANSEMAVWVETKIQGVWAYTVWHDPRLYYPKKAVSGLSWLLLPEMLYHEDGFKHSMIGPKGALAQDTVIGPSWNRWREEIIGVIATVKMKRKESIFRFLGWVAKDKLKNDPAATMLMKLEQKAKLSVKKITGTVAKIAGHSETEEMGWRVLNIMNNDFILRMMDYLRAGLEGKDAPILPDVRFDEDFSAFRDPKNSVALIERREVPLLPKISSSEEFPALRDPSSSALIQRRLQRINSQTARETIAISAPTITGHRLDTEPVVSPSPQVNLQTAQEVSVMETPVADVHSMAEQSAVVNVLPLSVNSQTARSVLALRPVSQTAKPIVVPSVSRRGQFAQEDLERSLAEAMNVEQSDGQRASFFAAK